MVSVTPNPTRRAAGQHGGSAAHSGGSLSGQLIGRNGTTSVTSSPVLQRRTSPSAIPARLVESTPGFNRGLASSKEDLGSCRGLTSSRDDLGLSRGSTSSKEDLVWKPQQQQPQQQQQPSASSFVVNGNCAQQNNEPMNKIQFDLLA